MGDLSKNFNLREFTCKCGCGVAKAHPDLVEVLQDVRDHFGTSVRIISGYRCPKHNREVGGEVDSQHLKGKADDIVVEDVPPGTVADCLCDKYPGKYGIGRYATWTHIDVRSGPPKRWPRGV
jgi:uncharacterized protein YcbK (DUF882 family)